MIVRTALQFYFNPDDIEIVIGEEEGKSNIWGIVITRGPRNEHHPFNLLLSSNETANFTKEKALDVIETKLRSAKKFGDELWTSPDQGGLLGSIICRGFKSKEEYLKNYGPVLEDSDIETILIELKNDQGKNKHTSSTYRWKIWKERYPK